MKQITVIGSLNYDMLFKQQRLPQKGETYTCDNVSFCAGGKGANQAVQCAKLGAKTYMAGKVGQDSFGDFLCAQLDEYGVDRSYVGRSQTGSGLAEVNVLEDGAVFATIFTGANFEMLRADIDALDSLLANSEILILQLEIPILVVEYAIQRARAHGVYVLLNAAPAKPISDEALRGVDCLVVNETEASFYVGETIDSVESARKHCGKLLARIGAALIITLGKQGSLLCTAQGTEYIPACTDVTVVETTGAGDSYIGAFATRKLLGEDDLSACRFATLASGVTITKVGAQPAMPTLANLQELLKQD